MHRRYPFYLAVLMLALLMLLSGGKWFHQPTLLERIQDDGTLVVVTQLGPSAVQHSSSGPTGLEYELVKAFADQLGVDIRLVLASNTTEVYQALVSGQAHLAAAGLAIPEHHRKQFRYTDPYLHVESHVLYRYGNPAPDNLSQLASMDGRLGVVAGSTYVNRLEALSGEIDGLEWEEIPGSVEELLYRVWNRELEFAIADSNDLLQIQRHYPELRIGFSLNDGESLAWAFPDNRDDSLFATAELFFSEIRESGMLARLQEQYFGHLGAFDYVGVRTFLRHVTERLPRYRDTFMAAAEANNLDWRLLAAISYQESHWNPRAVSPTGVRGLMMLTQRTAGQLGVNRMDTTESIHGGARYFRSMHDRLPERIEDPIRSWMALAAYNVGLGHLEDARILTEQNGRDPDAWRDVKDHLPLLSDPEWHSRTRFGYARGWEPVNYVTKVRSYYDMLVRVTELPIMDALEQYLPTAQTVQELHDQRMQLGGAAEAAF